MMAPRSRGIRMLERMPAAAAICVAVGGATLLAAWSIGGQLPLAWGHNSLVVMPSTALSLLLLGVSLWLSLDPTARWALYASRFLATVAMAVVALFVIETITGHDLGIDLLLFPRGVLTHGGVGPGRPAPDACLGLFLVGCALLTLDVTIARTRRPAHWAAMGALVIAFTTLVGDLNGAAHLYDLATSGDMAVFTAMGIAALSLGVLFARRATGLAAILIDDAAAGVMARGLFPAAVLVPIGLGWLWLWGQRLGLWSHTDGVSIFVVASSVALVWLVARSARVVHTSDVQRTLLLVREQEARREAEAANRSKGDFLAVMSHELRTPLSAIIGYQELLADGITGPINEAQQQQLGRIKVSARHLLQLIDEILTYSRAEAGKEEVRLEPTLVNGILDDAAALIEPLAADKRVAFVVDRTEATLAVRTDSQKVRQILVNLLTNAVKFTDAGGTVTLRARYVDGRLELTIADTGIGIAPEFMERIFDPFWQVEQKPTRRAGGTGLGLSVSRRLAHLLGGDLGVTSRAGQGSIFTVILPAAPSTARPVALTGRSSYVVRDHSVAGWPADTPGLTERPKRDRRPELTH